MTVTLDEVAVKTILEDIKLEAARQLELWGVQKWPIGNGTVEYKVLEDRAKAITEGNALTGQLTYADILLEEVYEALAARGAVDVTEELIQVAAVVVSMIIRINTLGLD